MNELIANLGIDWKLLLAQIINFAILFFLLKKFLYKPILGMLDKRRLRIEKSLKDADRIEKELVQIREKREDILRNANQKADAILKEAREIAESRRVEILEEVRKEAKAVLEETKKSIKKEKKKLVDDAKKDLAGIVILATEKMIKEKLDEDKDKKLAEEVLSMIKEH